MSTTNSQFDMILERVSSLNDVDISVTYSPIRSIMKIKWESDLSTPMTRDKVLISYEFDFDMEKMEKKLKAIWIKNPPSGGRFAREVKIAFIKEYETLIPIINDYNKLAEAIYKRRGVILAYKERIGR